MDCVNCRAYDAYFDTNNTAGVITVYNNANGATGTVTCAAVFPPQTIGSDVNFITVTTTDATIYYKLPQSVNFAAGQQYAYKLSTYVDKERKIGDVICSDGTMCEYSKRGNRTPVAVIAYVGSNTGNSTYCHGLAILLKQRSTSTPYWSKYLSNSNPIQMTGTTPPVEDGASYNISKYLEYKEYSWGIEIPYQAFRAAYYTGYSDPQNTSGWFLGSAYQWERIMMAMGKTDTERYNNLSTLFSTRGGEELILNNNSMSLWTCTEYDNEYAWYIKLQQDNSNKTYKYSIGKEKKNNDTKHKVRSMLAF